MNLFNSMVSKAFILNEARSSRHAGAFDLSLVAKQLKDKGLGVPYRDARRFWYSWAQDAGIWPEVIKAESPIPMDAKSINSIIGAYVTGEKFSEEASKQWEQYASDPKNLTAFIGSLRATRNKLATDASQNVPITPEEIKQRKDTAKQQGKVDTGKVDIAELKLRILPKFDSPKMKQSLINNLLETETDDFEVANQIAEDAVSSVADAFKNGATVDDIFNNLGELQQSGSSTTADLAEAAFNYLKKIVTVEDEEQPSPEMGTAQAANPEQVVAHESYVANYMGESSKYSKPKVIFENNRKKFKPKNIHQLIQAQNQSIY